MAKMGDIYTGFLTLCAVLGHTAIVRGQINVRTIYGEMGTDTLLPCAYPAGARNKSAVGVTWTRLKGDDTVDHLYHFGGGIVSFKPKVSVVDHTSIRLKNTVIEDEQYKYKCVVTFNGTISNEMKILVVTDKSGGTVRLSRARFDPGELNKPVQDYNNRAVLRPGSTLYLTAVARAFRPPAKLVWMKNGSALLHNGRDILVKDKEVFTENKYGNTESNLTYIVKEGDEGVAILCDAVGPEKNVWVSTKQTVSIRTSSGGGNGGSDGAHTTKTPSDRGSRVEVWLLVVIILVGLVLLGILVVLIIMLVLKCRKEKQKILRQREKGEPRRRRTFSRIVEMTMREKRKKQENDAEKNGEEMKPLKQEESKGSEKKPNVSQQQSCPADISTEKLVEDETDTKGGPRVHWPDLVQPQADKSEKQVQTLERTLKSDKHYAEWFGNFSLELLDMVAQRRGGPKTLSSWIQNNFRFYGGTLDYTHTARSFTQGTPLLEIDMLYTIGKLTTDTEALYANGKLVNKDDDPLRPVFTDQKVVKASIPPDLKQHDYFNLGQTILKGDKSITSKGSASEGATVAAELTSKAFFDIGLHAEIVTSPVHPSFVTGIKVTDENAGTLLSLDISNFYALKMEGWPPNADHWRSNRNRKWPSQLVVDPARDAGCHLVQPVETESDQRSPVEWNIMFAAPVKALLGSLSDNQILCYSALTLLHYHRLATVTVDNESLPFSLTKNVFFLTLENIPESHWTTKRLRKNLQAVLARFDSHLSQNTLPHYFVRDCNLLKNISETLRNKLLAEVRAIKQEPLDHIPWQAVNEYLDKNEKNPVYTSTKKVDVKSVMKKIVGLGTVLAALAGPSGIPLHTCESIEEAPVSPK